MQMCKTCDFQPISRCIEQCNQYRELQLLVKIRHRMSVLYGSVALLVVRRTNDRKVASSRPTKVVCITVLTGNRMGVNCPLWTAATPSSEL